MQDATARTADEEPTAQPDLTGREEFATWVRPHWDGMAALARRLGTVGDWEDVLQDALSDAWRKRHQFDPSRGSARNWLLAIVADKARKHRRRAVVRIAGDPVDAGYEDDLGDPDLDERLSRAAERVRADRRPSLDAMLDEVVSADHKIPTAPQRHRRRRLPLHRR